MCRIIRKKTTAANDGQAGSGCSGCSAISRGGRGREGERDEEGGGRELNGMYRTTSAGLTWLYCNNFQKYI